MYRATKRYKERCSAMGKASVAARARKRMSEPAPEYPTNLPRLRRVITITDYDFSEKTVRMELRRSDRIDCYDAYIDGKLWKSRIGWSRVQEWIRKAFPRIRAI
jgi:hypothetical protein